MFEIKLKTASDLSGNGVSVTFRASSARNYSQKGSFEATNFRNNSFKFYDKGLEL